MKEAVLFRSENRFETFKDKLEKYGVNVTVLDFQSQDWITYDFGKTDIVIYFPSFKYSSNTPLALYEVYDNLSFIHDSYPGIRMFPDPGIIKYYSDKYRQFLFLKKYEYPYPETYPLYSPESFDMVEKQLGYPMVLKNRYGAGGDQVFFVDNRKQLEKYYRISVLDFFNPGSIGYFLNKIRKRNFYYWLVKRRQLQYPFLSAPLLAQKFIPHDCDLKTVVGKGKVVEAHWRRQADKSMWKMNIDGGGIGEWSRVPEQVIQLSEKLAADLRASWVNIDLIESNNEYLVSEFSPVWHHYAYKESPDFVYKDDYNIDVPLEKALDLERIIVESLIE